MLFSTPALTDDDNAVLEAIEAHRSELRFNLGSSKRWAGMLARQQRARDVLGSNSIEGIHVSKDEALAMTDDQDELVDVDDDWLAVKGYSDAMTYARIMAEEGRQLTGPDLLALHFMVTSHDLTKSPGRLRSNEVYVQEEATGKNVYVGPGPDIVPELIGEFLETLSEPLGGVHPFVAAAMAHLNLVMIHPFKDGNGRISRILQSWFLYRENLADADFVSIEEYLGRNTRAYYDVLADVGAGQWSPQRDAGPWVEFMLTAHYRQAMTIRRRVKFAEYVAVKVDALIEEHGLPERAASPLEFCFNGWRLNNSHYRRTAAVTPGVASRDLRALTTAGILNREGDKKGASYLPTTALREWLGDIRLKTRSQFDLSIDPYRALRRGQDLM